MIGISAITMASEMVDERLTKKEVVELVTEIKQDLNLCEDKKLEFEMDEDGNIKPDLIKVIRIYDKNNDLLLEAPIHTLEQMANKQLRTIVNASDFLAESNNVFIYRLDF